MNQKKSAEQRHILFCMAQSWNMHIFFHRDASCPQNLHRLPEETHIKRLSGLGHEGTAFQRYCFCQRYKQRGLEGQATGGKLQFFFIHTNLLSFWKKWIYALKSCTDFTHFSIWKNLKLHAIQDKGKGRRSSKDVKRILKKKNTSIAMLKFGAKYKYFYCAVLQSLQKFTKCEHVPKNFSVR